MNKIVIGFLIIIFGVTGCATAAEWEAAKEKRREAQFLSFQKECEAYGTIKGTDSYVKCMLTVSKRAVDERNQIANRNAYIKANEKPLNFNVLENVKPFTSGFGNNNSFRCTSTKIGNRTTTNCY